LFLFKNRAPDPKGGFSGKSRIPSANLEKRQKTP